MRGVLLKLCAGAIILTGTSIASRAQRALDNQKAVVSDAEQARRERQRILDERAAAAAAAAAAGTDAAADDPEPGTDDETPVPPNCIRVAGQDQCGLPEEQVAEQIFAEGPQILSSGNRRLTAQGFVRSGWPVAVDFRPQPNSRTTLSITIYKPKPGTPESKIRIVLDPDGTGGRQLYRTAHVELPAEVDPPPPGSLRIATFKVTSRRIKPNGKLSSKHVPVEVFSLAVGPRAASPGQFGATGTPLPGYPPPDGTQFRRAGLPVWQARPWRLAALQYGSAPSENRPVIDIQLANGVPVLPMPRARTLAVPFQYMLTEHFDLVREDLRSARCTVACPLPVKHEGRKGRNQGEWQIGPGLYTMFVHAWMRCMHADFRTCEDEAVWLTGRAGPVRIR